jgi:ABC-type polysaccharide/polyol phosphate transport system ATPase subunit
MPASIRLDDVCLTFRVYRNGRMPLKEWLLCSLLRQRKNPVIEVPALRHVSFEVREGERLGIIGRNGAGKSTLLKVLAGIYRPTSGACTVEGRVCSLFDIALGFEMDANGWDNILYRGYLQRETPRTMRAKAAAIAEFSELGEALDMPVRYYSAGMLVRLAFAISTAIEPEVLLVDEVLAAGDKGFQIKARQRMRELIDKAKLIVLVSHDLGALARLCDRVLWLDRGHMREVGPTAETIAAYTRFVQEATPRKPQAA